MPQASEAARNTPPKGSQDPAEVWVRLEGGHEPIQAEGQDASADKGQTAVLADPLPDQPGPADLGEGGHGEQEDGAQYGHGRTLPRRRALAWEPWQWGGSGEDGHSWPLP